MIESYIVARERLLKPGGKMYPDHAVLHAAPFSAHHLRLLRALRALRVLPAPLSAEAQVCLCAARPRRHLCRG